MFDQATISQLDIFAEVLKERRRQDVKFGIQEHENQLWALILGEEFGEVQKAMMEDKVRKLANDPVGNMREEVLQCAAVCFAWLESLKRNQE